MTHISIDIETYSSVPIAKAGAYKYVQSPDFEVLLFAYSVDGSPVEIVDLAQGELLPEWLFDALSMAHDKKPHLYKNSEGYNDPTVGEAMSNIEAEERRVLERISALIPIMKKTAELVGFEVVGRIILMDKETGKKYK